MASVLEVVSMSDVTLFVLIFTCLNNNNQYNNNIRNVGYAKKLGLDKSVGEFSRKTVANGPIDNIINITLDVNKKSILTTLLCDLQI